MIGISGVQKLSDQQIAILRELMRELNSSDPFFGFTPEKWPSTLVVNCPGQHLLSSWLVAVIVTLLRMANECAFQGEVVSSQHDRLVLALPWTRKSVLEKAIRLSVDLMPGIVDPNGDESRREFLAVCRGWFEQVSKEGYSPATLRFAYAALGINIPVTPKAAGVVQLGWGSKAVSLYGSFTSRTNNLATRAARHKMMTKEILVNAFLPVPRGHLLQNRDRLAGVVAQLGWPLVVKPVSQDQGEGVVANIRHQSLLESAFDAALKVSQDGVIVEKHVEGDDHRMLVVGGKLLMASKRINGGVTGDGVNTIETLVEQENRNPLRGVSPKSLMIRLSLDQEAMSYLNDQGLSAETVPALGQFVPLRRTANISTGGTAMDVTSIAHPDNILAAERAARLIGLDIAGVDFLCPDISRSWREVGGAICEVNAQPGLRPHWLSDPGRDINLEIVKWLVPEGAGRIPVTLLVGKLDASKVAWMLSRMWKFQGHVPGVGDPTGAWVGDNLISVKPADIHQIAKALLNEPEVDAVTLALSYKHFMQSGHLCDRYDVVVISSDALRNVEINEGVPPAQAQSIARSIASRVTRAVVVEVDFVKWKSLAVPNNVRVVGVKCRDTASDKQASFSEMVSVETDNGVSRIIYHSAKKGAQQLFCLPEVIQPDSERDLLMTAAVAIGYDISIDGITTILSQMNESQGPTHTFTSLNGE